MSAIQFTLPPRAYDAGLWPGARLFAMDLDDEPKALYADAELQVPLENPLTADSAGRFPALWVADDEYRIVLEDAEGNEIWDLDPFETFPNSDNGMPLDDSGRAMPNAVLTFWLASTTQLTPIYSDDMEGDPLDNPITADGDGVFPDIWLNDEVAYRVRLEDGNGVLIFDIDNYQLLPIATGGGG